MSAKLEASARYVSCLGRTLEVAFQARGWVAVIDDGDPFPDTWERGKTHGADSWVKVPKSQVERMWRRDVGASWDGERIHITAVLGDRVAFQHGENQAWAEAHELEGSRYEGFWAGYALVAEISDVAVTETESAVT